MDVSRIISCTDHTMLKQDASVRDILKLCDEAIGAGPASICIPPYHVKTACRYLEGRIPVCTVIGFPNGYNTMKTKLYEACDALADGADELDMVICLAAVKSNLFETVRDEITMMKELCGTKILKVIVETCLLTEEEKIRMCEIVTQAGADYIKTSTGFACGGAALDDVRLFKEHIGPDVRSKAAGGIRYLEP